MRKLCLISITMILSLFVGMAQAEAKTVTDKNQATKTFQEGKHYTKLKALPYPDKQVIEIFTFNCPACYAYENKFGITEMVSSSLPEDTKFVKYHYANFGKLGPELATAWAIANATNKTHISKKLFAAVQDTRSIRKEEDIMNVFTRDDRTMTLNRYNSLKNDFLVRAFLSKQQTTIAELSPKYFPTFYVNNPKAGVFLIETKNLDNSSLDIFKKEMMDVINYLNTLQK